MPQDQEKGAGTYAGTVKVGEKGQIVIPKGVRDLFDIQPGDIMLVLADTRKGIALVKNDTLLDLAGDVLGGRGEEET